MNTDIYKIYIHGICSFRSKQNFNNKNNETQ